MTSKEKKHYSKWPYKFTEAMQLFTRAEIIIYSILCTRANDKGKVWPGYESLIEDTKADRKTIAKALKKLQRYEFLELVTRRYHDSTIYRVTQPKDMTSIYEELERRGLPRFTWLHDREESNESKWSGFHFHSDSNNSDEKVKVESEQSQSGVSDESKWNSDVVKVESDGTETTLKETTLNTSTLKDSLGTSEEDFVSDADIPKTGISTPSKANALVPKDRDIQEDSKNGNSLNEDESNSTHPVSKSANSGAKEILESSVPIDITHPESEELVSSEQRTLIDQGENMTSTTKNRPFPTREQTEKHFRDLLKARSTQDEWKAFLQFEKTLPHGRVTAAIEVGFNMLDHSVSDVLETLEGMSAND